MTEATLSDLVAERDDLDRQIAAISIASLTTASTMLDGLASEENIQTLRTAVDNCAEPSVQSQLSNAIILLTAVPEQLRRSLALMQAKAAPAPEAALPPASEPAPAA